MRRWLPLVALVLWGIPSWSQQTAVTATVRDILGDPYVNCTGVVSFVGENTSPGAGPYLVSGSVFQTSYPLYCSGSATLSLGLWDNVNAISPTPSQWQFSVCSAQGYVGGPYCFTTLITITGTSQDISAILAAGAPILPAGQVGFNIGSTTTCWGDSLMAGFNVTPASGNICNSVAATRGQTAVNNGVSGTAANDSSQFGTIVQQVELASNAVNNIWLCCVNDMRGNYNAAQQATWGQTIEANMWLLATPETAKVRSTSASLTYTGTWVAPPVTYGGNITSSIVNGSSVTGFVKGTDVVVIGAWQVGDSSTYKVTIDGNDLSTLNTNAGAYMSVAVNTNFGPTFIHVANLPQATHTVKYTCVSASAGNPCYFILFGTSFGFTVANSPFMAYGDTVFLVNPTGYNVTSSPNCLVAPCGSDALVASLNAIAKARIADLKSLGLNIFYIPVNAFYTPSVTAINGCIPTQADGVHPTLCGDSLLATAFITGMRGYITPADRGAAQTFGASVVTGFGVPYSGTCVAGNAGALYIRADGDPTHTLYVCDNSTTTWTPK